MHHLLTNVREQAFKMSGGSGVGEEYEINKLGLDSETKIVRT